MPVRGKRDVSCFDIVVLCNLASSPILSLSPSLSLSLSLSFSLFRRALHANHRWPPVWRDHRRPCPHPPRLVHGATPTVKRSQACGSGATTGGLALANHLSGYGAKVIGYGVCDNDDYFYDFIGGLLAEVGFEGDVRTLLRMRNSKGAGYAMSRCALTTAARAQATL